MRARGVDPVVLMSADPSGYCRAYDEAESEVYGR